MSFTSLRWIFIYYLLQNLLGMFPFPDGYRMLISAAASMTFIYAAYRRWGKRTLLTVPRHPCKAVCWYLPLVPVAVGNLFWGVNGWTPGILPAALCLTSASACEELLFRGIFLSELREHNAPHRILSSAMLFGLMHLLNLTGGLTAEAVIIQTAIALVFGSLFAILSECAGSIIPAVITHGMMNFTSLFAAPAPSAGLFILAWGGLSAAAVLYGRYMWDYQKKTKN